MLLHHHLNANSIKISMLLSEQTARVVCAHIIDFFCFQICRSNRVVQLAFSLSLCHCNYVENFCKQFSIYIGFIRLPFFHFIFSLFGQPSCELCNKLQLFNMVYVYDREPSLWHFRKQFP